MVVLYNQIKNTCEAQLKFSRQALQTTKSLKTKHTKELVF